MRLPHDRLQMRVLGQWASATRLAITAALTIDGAPVATIHDHGDGTGAQLQAHGSGGPGMAEYLAAAASTAHRSTSGRCSTPSLTSTTCSPHNRPGERRRRDPGPAGQRRRMHPRPTSGTPAARLARPEAILDFFGADLVSCA